MGEKKIFYVFLLRKKKNITGQQQTIRKKKNEEKNLKFEKNKILLQKNENFHSNLTFAQSVIKIYSFTKS